MSKKTFTLVSAIVGGVSTIASAIVTYINPTWAVAIVASVGIVNTAVVAVCNQFVKKE